MGQALPLPCGGTYSSADRPYQVEDILKGLVSRFRDNLDYSKKLSNQRAMISFAIAYHNLYRYPQTLRATPCMAQGITKIIWSIEDLLTATI